MPHSPHTGLAHPPAPCSPVRSLFHSGSAPSSRCYQGCPDQSEQVPLAYAAADGHAHSVELLVRNGADVHAKDMLMTTASHGPQHHHRDVIELLTKYGAHVSGFSKFDKSASDLALEKNNAEVLVSLQEAMQNQVNANPERVNPVAMATPFIFTSGDVVNLASLVNSPNAKQPQVIQRKS